MATENKIRQSVIVTVITALFTGIGGHYLNRRWDKAILFLCLFVLYLAAIYALFIFMFWTLTPTSSGTMPELNETKQLLSKASSLGIFAIWLTSLIITIRDRKNNIEPSITGWTKSGIVGAVITSFLSFLFLAIGVNATISLYSDRPGYRDTVSYETESPGFSSHNFYEYLYFGGSPSNSRNLPAPPIGEGKLKGRILFQNQPAADVSLAIVLNSKYRAKDITTDAEGIFTVSLPPGPWTINSVQTESWKNQPEEGSFSMYSGREEKLSGDEYRRHDYFKKNGYPVNITPDPEIFHLEATIRKDIQLIWPNPKAEGIRATVDDTIMWDEYPGANRYYIEINKMQREGTTTHYEEVTSRILHNETSIPLAGLKYKKTSGKEPTEYSTRIYAFSEDGTLIAEFSDTFQGGTFLLSDGNILIEDRLDDLFDLASIEDQEEFEEKIEAISLNKSRATAVSTLIDDNLLSEAETLLELIDSEYSQGKKEALSGYIMALQGECNNANRMFDKAQSINPDVCIPGTYKAKCE